LSASSERGGTTITLGEAVELSRESPVISSGSAAIDSLLQGGYRGGELVEVYGESNTGKTQLAMQAALSCAARDSSVLYIDTEGTFRPERMDAIARAKGLDGRELLRKVYRMRAADASSQIEASRLVHTKAELAGCRMIVVDTVTKNFSVEYPGSKNLTRRQGLLSVYLSGLARDAFLMGRAVLLTNRVTSFRTPAGSREAHIGGETLSQMVHRSIHLTREGGRGGGRILASLTGWGGGLVAEGVISERGFS